MNKVAIKIKPFKLAFAACLGWKSAEFVYKVMMTAFGKMIKDKEDKDNKKVNAYISRSIMKRRWMFWRTEQQRLSGGL